MAIMQKFEQVLGVFAKWPRPGLVKSRLAADTSPEWAAQVAEAFLEDTLDRLACLPVQRILAYSPVEAERYFAQMVRDRFSLWPQPEGDLGQRMAAFFRQFLVGETRVVLMGADSPTLPLPIIEEAFVRLEKADVVIGPATDGGYYLIGCAPCLPPIFEGIPWGSSGVLKETMNRWQDYPRRLEDSPAGLNRLDLLPPWYDVDTLDDWRMLEGHLWAMRQAGIDPGTPRTETLSDLRVRGGCV